jgi:general secretion pathway protein C
MNLAVGERVRAQLRNLSGNWPVRLFLGLLTLILIIQAVRLIYAIVTPASPLGDWRPRAAETMPATAKSELFARVDPFYRTIPTSEDSTSAVTGLQIQLFGIRMNQASAGGSAIIAGGDGVQNSIGIGEEIQPGVRLVAVHFDHVEIDNAGKRELLYLDQADVPTAGTTNAGGSAAPPQPAPAAAPTSNPASPISPSSLRAGIAFTPRSEGGRVTGIAIGQQGDGSAFQAAGFRNGDVIRAINGRVISSVSDAASLTAQLQPGARLSLEVERGAGTVPIAITIPTGNP